MGIVRKTKSVRALLNEFDQTKVAISALELVERLPQQMNRSTVYRILERLEDDKTLHSFTGKDGLAWYALNPKNGSHSSKLHTHPHFQCEDCGKTECIPVTVPIPDMAERSIESISLLIVGKCADCVT